ncbi:hypothetical protein [Roseimicrobium sp. ORNL1]|uniref:hypothetical protein n=1 Tax=Roseimicrobium sp. ORNL1 TaxID=2711231 RepID=UPI0013E12FBB|nr:hypothetical protein [Roseimicrobium sp. ORNL1]QIF02007.1 hypothetical protein G5S37_10850 [Roseimicrobium sp. ORNL1]
MKLFLLLSTLLCVCACSTNRNPSSTSSAKTASLEPFRLPAYLLVPGNLHENSKTQGNPVPRTPGEVVQAVTFAHGSGQGGFDSVRLDREGNVVFVIAIDENNRRYERHTFQVPAEKARALLDGTGVQGCFGLHRLYTAGVNDGSQAFMRIDSNKRGRTYWFDNFYPERLKQFTAELDRWIAQADADADAVRVGVPRRDDGFQVYHQSAIH